MNRDLQRRIRSVSGITLERPVLRADARLAARLAHLLDTRTKLWHDSSEEQEKDGEQANKNEVLIPLHSLNIQIRVVASLVVTLCV